MKNKIKLTALLLTLAALSMTGLLLTVCDNGGNDNYGDNGDNGGHWLISSQGTANFIDGEANYSPTTYYTWIAYRYTDKTNYEEEYTTYSSVRYNNSSSETYSEYHYTRNGQTSYSTTETITNSTITNDYPDYTSTLSSGTSSTTSSYDSATGFTASSMTVSSGRTTETVYGIELLSDSDGLKTYKYYPVGSNWYNIIKVQNGRTLETSYYNEYTRIYTTTYTQPDNAEILSRLPDFRLYNTQYYSSSYSISSSYQTAEVMSANNSELNIRVKTFNDNVLSSQTDYGYGKINFNENPFRNGVVYEYELDDDDNYIVDSTYTWTDNEGRDHISYSYVHKEVKPKRWGDYWYGDNGKIYKWTGRGSNVVIPAQINGKPVIGIGSGSNSYNSYNGSGYYNSIGVSFGAFSNCYKLTSVTIPNSVTSIGMYAFAGCWSLTNVIIPNSVTNIALGAFSGCLSLTNITIPNSVTNIRSRTFSGTGLTSITIPNSVTRIGEGAFSGTGLTSVTIPNSVTYLNGFSYCTGLTSITIPNSVTSIGENAFSYTGLTSVTIPNSVTSIGENAFFYTGLTSVTIPNSVTSIGANAFYGTGLTSVTIPNSVTSIGGMAFSGCQNLTSVTFQGTIPASGIGGIIPSYSNNAYYDSFDGDLDEKYLAGGAGTYTRRDMYSGTWKKQ